MNASTWRRWPAAVALAFALALAGCASGTIAATHAGTPGSDKAGKPTATATVDPAATPTAGPPCHGGLWQGGIIAAAGPGIPLPPLTVAGQGETFPADSAGWSGHYVTLCTSGNPDAVSAFVEARMAASGWSYGPPAGGCECNGDFVWTRPGDPRQVQFDSHMSLITGTVRWGVTIFTKG